MNSNLPMDLNTTIANAVNARVEAELVAALAGDNVIGKFVAAALQEQVQKDPRGYSRDTEPYVHHILRLALQEAAKKAVQEFVQQEIGVIEEEVRKALKRNASKVAQAFATNLTEKASQTYGLSVEIDLRFPKDYG